ncbi:MAG TPA: hypothetical protein VFG50_10970, partial [Rhodothermales bacterium]|nr:hypothetical protein [Rhodothermales bacterium]
PGWSPDGKQVVFRRVTWDYCHYQDPGYGEIWIVNADGSGEHQVTFSYHSRQTNITARAVP